MELRAGSENVGNVCDKVRLRTSMGSQSIGNAQYTNIHPCIIVFTFDELFLPAHSKRDKARMSPASASDYRCRRWKKDQFFPRRTGQAAELDGNKNYIKCYLINENTETVTHCFVIGFHMVRSIRICVCTCHGCIRWLARFRDSSRNRDFFNVLFKNDEARGSARQFGKPFNEFHGNMHGKRAKSTTIYDAIE